MNELRASERSATAWQRWLQHPPAWLCATYLALAFVVVMWPFLGQGYTLSQNPAGWRQAPLRGLGEGLPVLDPAAASHQDEPWLVMIQESYRRGVIPVVNLRNGMGAPLVESLQPGVLYILNPLLLLLPTSSPLAFDLFCMAHAALLLVGMYWLLSLYADRSLAAPLAVLVALSGVTYQNFGMVHYRGFAWLPWMLFAAVSLARGSQQRRYVWLFLLATLGSGTAGNVQDFAISFGVTLAVFVIESWAGKTWNKRLPLLFAGALMAASPCVVAYFVSRSDGNLVTVANSGRSVVPYDLAWMSTWMMPRLNGIYPFLYHDGPFWAQADYTTPGFFLLLVACVLLWRFRTQLSSGTRFTLAGMLLLGCIGTAKILSAPFFSFVQYIPLFGDILYVKYTLYLHVLAGIVGAIALTVITRMPERERRAVLQSALLAFLVIAALAALYLAVSPRWGWHDVSPAILAELVQHFWLPNTLAFGALCALLWRWQPANWIAFAGVAGLVAACAVPNGYHQRTVRYADANSLAPVQAKELAALGTRVVSNRSGNDNLFFGSEFIGVFDPILNLAHRDAMHPRFQVQSPWFDTTPNPNVPLKEQQVSQLRLLGVSQIHGYRGVTSTGDVETLPALLEGALPRVFLVSSATAEAVNQHANDPMAVQQVLTLLQADIQALPQPALENVGDRTLRWRMPASSGVLVINQAYSTNWTLEGERAQPFFRLYAMWPQRTWQARSYEAAYWPRGLTQGLGLSAAGLLLVGFTSLWFSKYRHAASQRSIVLKETHTVVAPRQPRVR